MNSQPVTIKLDREIHFSGFKLSPKQKRENAIKMRQYQESESRSGFVVFPQNGYSPSHSPIINWVMEVGTFKAYPLYRKVCPDVKDYLDLRSAERKEEHTAFPYGAFVQFRKSVVDDKVVISEVLSVNRTYIFADTRVTRGIGEELNMLFLHSLGVKIPMEPRHNDEFAPGVSHVCATQADVDFSVKDLPHQPVTISIVSINSHTAEELEWSFSGWAVQKLDHQWKDSIASIFQKPGFIKRAMRCGYPAVMMVVNDMFLFDATRPFLPIVVWDQRKKRPVHRVKGDMVKVFAYDSHLTEIVFVRTGWNTRKKLESTLPVYEKCEAIFRQNCMLWLDEMAKRSKPKNESATGVCMLMNVPECFESGRRREENGIVHYLAEEIMPELNLVLQGEDLVETHLDGFASQFTRIEQRATMTNGKTKEQYDVMCKEISNRWGRLDFVVMLSDRGKGAKEQRMSVKPYLKKYEIDPVTNLVEGIREFITDFGIQIRFLHIDLNEFSDEKILRPVRRAIKALVTEVGIYLHIPFSVVKKYHVNVPPAECPEMEIAQSIDRLIKEHYAEICYLTELNQQIDFFNDS
ncbi:unnamed protein product [Bursaphelenchus xylophilus]|nr:unnamed protein product [Bursaphelenchus xylophilus]CAG9089020.1 unnamed protein product [Bursaphelenchus xylophilus]